jgi:hypothetical protein
VAVLLQAQAADTAEKLEGMMNGDGTHECAACHRALNATDRNCYVCGGTDIRPVGGIRGAIDVPPAAIPPNVFRNVELGKIPSYVGPSALAIMQEQKMEDEIVRKERKAKLAIIQRIVSYAWRLLDGGEAPPTFFQHPTLSSDGQCLLSALKELRDLGWDMKAGLSQDATPIIDHPFLSCEEQQKRGYAVPGVGITGGCPDDYCHVETCQKPRSAHEH